MRHSRWLVVMATLCAVGVAAAQLDTGWPCAGQGHAKGKSVTGVAPSVGPGLGKLWNTTGFPGEVSGSGGMVLSSDGYLWFRTQGTGNVYQLNATTGAVLWSYPLGSSFRSAPLITTSHMFVSAGEGTPDAGDTTSGILIFDRFASPPTRIKKMYNATVNSTLRSLMMGTVQYGGHLRVYASRRAGTSYYISAWDPQATPGSEFKWEVALNGNGTSGGLVQLGAMWVDTGTGKQMISAATGNGSAPVVFQVRDDDTSGTIVYQTNLAGLAANGVMNQTALSQDGKRLYYNTANDGGLPPLAAVSTETGAVVWQVPVGALPGVNTFVASPAVIGDRIYLAGGGANVACVKDNQDGTYSVQWVHNVAEALNGEFTSISACKTTDNKTFLYGCNGSQHKIFRIEDLGSSASTLSSFDYVDTIAWGGNVATIDGQGNVYVNGNTAGGVFKLKPVVPPIANAGADFNAACYATINLDGSASAGQGGATLVNFNWKALGATIYDGPNATATAVLPLCNGPIDITLTVTDNFGGIAQDIVTVTIGDYPAATLQFATSTGPAVGDFMSSMASDGTYLYWLNNSNGKLYRTTGGVCNPTWTEMATAPGATQGDQCGALAFTPGFEDAANKPSLITYRRPAADASKDAVATIYDIATDTWTQYRSIYFGDTGYVVVGNRAFGNLHAWDTNLGGSFGSLLLNLGNTPNPPWDGTDATTNDWITEGVNAIKCWHSSIKSTFGPFGDANWFSRVLQQAVVNNSEGTRVYGFKCDWQNGLTAGDRLFKWNPADWTSAVANHYNGPGWYDWQSKAGFNGVELGRLPREIGYGSAVVALPANWKSLVGAQGGLFVIFGKHPFASGGDAGEGRGGPQREYGLYDIATGQWSVGYLPDYSSSGTAAAFHNGEVYIKQGAASDTNPDGGYTDKFWTISFLPPIVVNPGGPYTYNGTGCGAQSVPVNGSAPTATTFTWKVGATTVGTGPTGPLSLLPGTYTVTLFVTGPNCTTGQASTTVTVTSNSIQPLPALFAMADAGDIGYGDVVTQADAGDLPYPTGVGAGDKEAALIAFGLEGDFDPAPVTTALLGGGKWWYGPWVDLTKACFGAADLSAPDTIVRFTATFYQADRSDPNATPAPYADAPIFVSFRDVNGAFATIGIVYGSDMTNDPDKYPAYKTVEAYLELVAGDMTLPAFDLSRVTRVEFHGTDWSGEGADWVSIRDLYIGPGDPRGACCLPDDSCTFGTQDACVTAGGDYQGDGVACTAELCVNEPLCPGDGNCDGVIDWRDIDFLVAAQNDNEAAWAAMFTGTPSCQFLNNDSNGDAHVDWRDIDPFVALMNTLCP